MHIKSLIRLMNGTLARITCSAAIMYAALGLVPSAHAQSLNFELPSLPSGGGNGYEQILNYYNGGTDQYGDVGPNYGIVFGSDALALGQYPAAPGSNTGNEPGGGNALFFLNGTDIMDVAGGFTTGFSFYYDCPANLSGTVTVWSGLDGTGTELASLALPGTSINSTEPYFGNWTPIGLSFAGIAESVDFAGTANQITFADVTLNSSTPGGGSVPDGGNTLLLLGASIAALAIWKRGGSLWSSASCS